MIDGTKVREVQDEFEHMADLVNAGERDNAARYLDWMIRRNRYLFGTDVPEHARPPSRMDIFLIAVALLATVFVLACLQGGRHAGF